MIPNSQLVTAFGELIEGRNWDIFLTTTFRRPKGSTEAKRAFKYFFKHLNTPAMAFFNKFVFALAVFERDSNRNGVHIHALLQGINPSLVASLEKKCREFFGDSVALPYDSDKAGRFYIARKYVSSQLDDYDILRINSRLRG